MSLVIWIPTVIKKKKKRLKTIFDHAHHVNLIPNILSSNISLENHLTKISVDD